MNTARKSRKVAITGAGDVGASFAYALAQTGLAEEIALIDINANLVKGQVLDLAHGLPFVPPVDIHAGSVDDYADATVIVITAGAKQRPGESRLDLINRNVVILSHIAQEIVASQSQAVIVVVSNPVDVLTYAAIQCSGLPKSRVIGSGTVLDSARFRYLLSQHCGVNVHNVHAYILGEHGDSEMAAWSMSHVAGMPIQGYCTICGKCAGWQEAKTDIVRQVRESAYHIIGYKGATYYAIGLALVRIVQAILRNENSVLTVSSLLEGEFGLRDVCLSVPCLVNATGVERIVEGNLDAAEKDALAASAQSVRQTIGTMDQAFLKPGGPRSA